MVDRHVGGVAVAMNDREIVSIEHALVSNLNRKGRSMMRDQLMIWRRLGFTHDELVLLKVTLANGDIEYDVMPEKVSRRWP